MLISAVQVTSHSPAQFIVGRVFIYLAVGLVENVREILDFQHIPALIDSRLFPHMNQKYVLHLFEDSAWDPSSYSSHLALS